MLNARTALALMACLALVLAGCRLKVPLEAEPAEASRFSPASRAGAELWVMPIRMGHQLAPRCAAAGEASCLSSIEIVHAAYLVKHPRATFLIESGLSASARDDLGRFSFIDRQALDFIPERGLGEALEPLKAWWGAPSFVLLTHGHWDHTSGLLELGEARVLMGPGEAEFVRQFPKERPPAAMPHHLERASLESFSWDGPPFENFSTSHDVFGDGSVVLVPLPGHTPGSLGVMLSSVRGRRVLFVGDAAWTREAVALPSHKLAPLSDLTDADAAGASEALWRLHRLRARYPDLLIVPTHDGEAFEELRQLAVTPRSAPAR